MGPWSHLFAGGAAGGAKAAGDVYSGRIAKTGRRELLAEEDRLTRERAVEAQGRQDVATADARKYAEGRTAEDRKYKEGITESDRDYVAATKSTELVAYDKVNDVFLTQKEMNERTDMEGVVPKEMVGKKNASKNGKWVQDKRGVWQFLTEDRSGEIEGLLKDGSGSGSGDKEKSAKEANKYFEKLITEFSIEGDKIPQSALDFLNEMRAKADMEPVTNKLAKEGWTSYGDKYGIKIGGAKAQTRAQGTIAKAIELVGGQSGVAPPEKTQERPESAPPTSDKDRLSGMLEDVSLGKGAPEPYAVKKRQELLSGMGARAGAVEKSALERKAKKKDLIATTLKKLNVPTEDFIRAAKRAQKEQKKYKRKGITYYDKTPQEKNISDALQALTQGDNPFMTIDYIVTTMSAE